MEIYRREKHEFRSLYFFYILYIILTSLKGFNCIILNILLNFLTTLCLLFSERSLIKQTHHISVLILAMYELHIPIFILYHEFRVVKYSPYVVSVFITWTFLILHIIGLVIVLVSCIIFCNLWYISKQSMKIIN